MKTEDIVKSVDREIRRIIMSQKAHLIDLEDLVQSSQVKQDVAFTKAKIKELQRRLSGQIALPLYEEE